MGILHIETLSLDRPVVAGAVARRLGMTEADAELTEFLVRQHLTMSHLSQRRDLSDPEVIARFAERVGDDEQLVQLYLLTLCDTANRGGRQGSC